MYATASNAVVLLMLTCLSMMVDYAAAPIVARSLIGLLMEYRAHGLPYTGVDILATGNVLGHVIVHGTILAIVRWQLQHGAAAPLNAAS